MTAGTFHAQKNTSTPYHLLQADAFLAGRLDIEPPEHRYDLDYRDGKWFTYWGYVPAATLVPFRWAFGQRLTDRHVAIAIGLLTMVVWYQIVRRLPRLGWPPLRQWEVLLLTYYCSFGQLTFHLAKVPVAAYTTHLFAFFFLSMSVLCLVPPTRSRLLAATVMFCLASLTRISLFLVAPMFIIVALAVTDDDWRFWRTRATLQLGLIMGAVVGLSACLQLYLNYLRFGTVLDFGAALMPATFPAGPTYSIRYVTKNLWIYLASPVRYSLTRPFVKGDWDGNAIWSYQFGILVPLLAVACTARKSRTRVLVVDGDRRRNTVLMLGLLTICCVYFVYLLFYRFTGSISFGGRYLLDTQPFLLLVIIMSYAVVRNRPAMRLVAVTCFLLSGVVQILSPPMLW